MIAINNVTKSFQDGESKRIILNDTSVSFNKGEKIGLVGRSGLGKSTILKILLGVETVDKGEIILDNIKVTAYKSKDLIKLRRTVIGYVFQNFNLIKNLTVEENILLPTFFYDGGRVNINNILESVELPKSILKQNVNTLSGGEKQRISIARALINSPKILLADEPTGNLDVATENSILELFNRINKEQKVTLVVVTHSSKVAKEMDKVYTICNGKITLDGGDCNE